MTSAAYPGLSRTESSAALQQVGPLPGNDLVSPENEGPSGRLRGPSAERDSAGGDSRHYKYGFPAFAARSSRVQ